MNINKKVELLAPAGNMEGFYGAIHAGADAVYLAGEKFGARAYAENFTTETLVECIRYGHLLGRKIYLTVNTLLKDNELSELYDYLLPFYEAGLDAVIVQDLGVFRFIREHFPGLKLHVSTQMTLCSSYGATLLKSSGASRIVPARELSLQELIRIKQQTGIEIETFIHGAMCYCYSGQCLFSSILGGRSGNRGRCAQPCRLPYSFSTGDTFGRECYPLSLKDMCTIEYIPQLVAAGIDSFKIEGRMKKPEYTAGVTAIYRRYIDWYYDNCIPSEVENGMESAFFGRTEVAPVSVTGTESVSADGSRKQVSDRVFNGNRFVPPIMKCRAGSTTDVYRVEKGDLELLKSLYIRSGIQDGYYFRRNGREMITMESPAYKGSDEKALSEIREKYIAEKKKVPVHIKAVFQVGHPVEVLYSWQDQTSRVTGNIVERASKQPVTPENIRKQLGKLGDSAFYAEKIDITADADCFYPLKMINELRREAVAGLEEKIMASLGYTNVNPLSVHPDEGNSERSSLQKGYAFSVCTLPQLEAIADWFSREKTDSPLRFYIDGDLFLQERQNVESLCSSIPQENCFYLALPYIIRETDKQYLERLSSEIQESGIFCGFLVRSMDGLGFARKMGGNLCCRADVGLYTWNHWAVQELSSYVEGFCLPYELRGSEQKGLLDSLPCEKIVYGRIPMMLTANCLFRTFGQCHKQKDVAFSTAFRKNGNHTIQKDGQHAILKDRYHTILKDRHHAILKDRYRREFPVVANCLHCMNIIYNSVPLSLHQALSRWKGLVDLRMDFTMETPEQVNSLLDSFLKGAPLPLKEYTNGHEKRGVE